MNFHGRKVGKSSGGRAGASAAGAGSPTTASTPSAAGGSASAGAPCCTAAAATRGEGGDGGGDGGSSCASCSSIHCLRGSEQPGVSAGSRLLICTVQAPPLLATALACTRMASCASCANQARPCTLPVHAANSRLGEGHARQAAPPVVRDEGEHARHAGQRADGEREGSDAQLHVSRRASPRQQQRPSRVPKADVALGLQPCGSKAAQGDR